ncbi:MAG: hypothetical protein K8R48_06435 [Alphaproteobacteria bacterium]|nr:hypothetical protein [Alphaproteobacteria bacterium]
MSLKNEFNSLTGKIISNTEFRARLREHGLDPEHDPKPSRSEMLRKLKQLEEAGEEVDLTPPATYVPGSAVAAIEQKVLREADEDIALEMIGEGIQALGAELYFEVLPAAKAMALFYDDEKVVDAYIEAAKECTDHRAKLDTGEIKESSEVFLGIAKKVETKFHR